LLLRFIYRGTSNGRQRYVTLVITDKNLEKHEVKLPHPTETALDLIPLQLALSGCQVEYVAKGEPCGPPSFSRVLHTVNVLRGPMRGKSYQLFE